MKKWFVLFSLLIASNCFAFSPTSMMQMGTSYTDVALTYSGATHTEGQCTAAGGTVTSTVGGTVCKFAQASAPSGWTQADNWSTTTAGSGTCTSVSCYSSVNCMGQWTAVTMSYVSNTVSVSSYHSWANTAIEFVSYYYYGSQPGITAGSTYNLGCSDTYDSISGLGGQQVCNSTLVNKHWRVYGTHGGSWADFWWGDPSTGYAYATITEIGCK